MKINIKGKQIELKNKLRSLMIYEQITEKVFNPVTVTDMILYFYCVVLANEPSIDLDFNSFMEILEDEPDLFVRFNEWIVKTNKINQQFSDEDADVKKNQPE